MIYFMPAAGTAGAAAESGFAAAESGFATPESSKGSPWGSLPLGGLVPLSDFTKLAN
jgi:hypothetical protein